MHYGFVIPGGDVEELVEIAQRIERAGWDAVFVADGVYGTDPWISLAAIAVRTSHVRIGPLLTPASRRRPWKLASETATLDRLSHGRVILSVGLGAIDTGFASVGEQTDRRIRGQLLDESLELVTKFWSGQPFRFDGVHYHVEWGTEWSYMPVQTPRIPTWVVGAWPREKSMQRALRYDGVLVAKMQTDGSFTDSTPTDVQAVAGYVREHRIARTPFDIVVEGVTPIGSPEQVDAIIAPLAQAGVTWWIESMWAEPDRNTVLARIDQGPPRV
jgi:alkanesulfonate monooxygenase SsuD/methylene tetrahydromethanopterin reductase-like flavin-dependent oxidoreductase (luciferase family)